MKYAKLLAAISEKRSALNGYLESGGSDQVRMKELRSELDQAESCFPGSGREGRR